MVTALYIGIIIVLIVIGGLLASIKGELEVLELYCKCLEDKLQLINGEIELLYESSFSPKDTMQNVSDEWTVSPEKAEKMYNAALENMRGYHKE